MPSRKGSGQLGGRSSDMLKPLYRGRGKDAAGAGFDMMEEVRVLLIGCLSGGLVLLARGPVSQGATGSQLKRTCSRCHSFDVVRAQRLSREEWERELAKMSLMGAKIENHAGLLDYLTKHYGDTQPQKSR